MNRSCYQNCYQTHFGVNILNSWTLVLIERIWGAEWRTSGLLHPELILQRTCWAPGAPILQKFRVPTTLSPNFCLSVLLTLHLTSIFSSFLLRCVVFHFQPQKLVWFKTLPFPTRNVFLQEIFPHNLPFLASAVSPQMQGRVCPSWENPKNPWSVSPWI